MNDLTHPVDIIRTRISTEYGVERMTVETDKRTLAFFSMVAMNSAPPSRVTLRELRFRRGKVLEE